MSNGFKPQMTDRASFTQTESQIFDIFVEKGCPELMAARAAHGFTQITLGYISKSELIEILIRSGADLAFASQIADLFESSAAEAKAGKTTVSKQLVGA
jgi:hypothetical protein